jgi:hypothetical protein
MSPLYSRLDHCRDSEHCDVVTDLAAAAAKLYG